MTLKLYPHQQIIFDDARCAIAEHDSILIQSETGSGKTVIGTMIAKSASERSRRVLFSVHRDFLIEQTYSAFSKVGLEIGIIAAGYTPNYRARVQIASIDTLKHRLNLLEDIDLLLVDECHHLPASGWNNVFQHLRGSGAKCVGLTATPWRLSGEGLRQFFSHMIQGPSTRWLIDNGFLSDYIAYAPSIPNLEGVHTRLGDYVKAELEEAMDKSTITGDAVAHLLKLAPSKRTVAFCCTVAHSEHVTAQFNAAGVPSSHIDANTPRVERKAIISAFRRGDTKLLSSVNIFGEGFDIPSIEAAILLRPTQSLSLHRQQVGRALRVFDGKDRAIILDHAGNLMRHGLPDTEIEWTLDGRKKKKKDSSAPPIKMCEACYFVYSPPVAKCPKCGHVHVTETRTPEQVDGELQEITPEMRAAMHAAKKKEVIQARTLSQLQELGKLRGYGEKWANHVYEARERAASAKIASQARSYML